VSRYNVLSVSSASKPGSQRVFIVVLLSIVKFAAASGQVPMLQGYFDLLDGKLLVLITLLPSCLQLTVVVVVVVVSDLVLKWSLSMEDARGLFLAVSEALDSAPTEHGLQDKAQLFLIK
jgi:hypothetical protein